MPNSGYLGKFFRTVKQWKRFSPGFQGVVSLNLEAWPQLVIFPATHPLVNHRTRFMAAFLQPGCRPWRHILIYFDVHRLGRQGQEQILPHDVGRVSQRRLNLSFG